jgi:3-dehydroquinate synthase
MEIKVDLSCSAQDGSYGILIDSGILNEKPDRSIINFLSSAGLKRGGRAFVVMSETVAGLYKSLIVTFLENAGINLVIFILPDGEGTKKLKYLSDIHDSLVENRFERTDFIVAFGGGVIGDLAGFAAATYLRGINFVQIPTTLLADVDSSVGGKTGIDHPKGKNLIGAFYQPKAVLIDVGLLKSLERRELINGFAEVIKYGAVLDASFFSYLENNYEKILSYESSSLMYIIERSCNIKADVVKKDEKESGLRSVLNFGHSLGHAIETLYNYENIKHGEAISIGMVFAASLSEKIGLCGGETVVRIKNLIENSGLPVKIPEFTAEQYINAMKLDKKVSENQIKFVLISDIGRYEFKKLDFDFIFDFLKKHR